MANTAESGASSATTTDQYAIYFELSPRLTWLVRIVNICTFFMVMISVILCFVQGHKNSSYYLIVCNLAISGFVCIVVNWWYKTGDLGSEKFWFILLICGVILWQCISSDIFIFKTELPAPTITTTPTPHTRNTTVFSWATMKSPITVGP
ncbi:uncharacterized protein LOC101858699 [Aplysia californica]|uniref:Uncharacterized protein LOC101858699 n=1 Tax=Aplysia californica TaxID=6500 RepID=A0ABM0JIX9_APLCA|nr:uncharacterized protein LOC101858699 [Aplysia californica]